MTHRCGQIRTRLALGLMISLGVMLGCTPDGGSDGGREDTSADDDGMSGSNLFDLDYLGGSDCGRSLGCDTYGWCTRDENSEQCVVGSDADCRRSEACIRFGRCTRDMGLSPGEFECRATSDDDCLASSGCAEEGECGWNGKPGNVVQAACEPRSDEDCQNASKRPSGQSVVIEDTFGILGARCSFETLEDCAENCTKYGRCAVSQMRTHCIAISDADCQASGDCGANGLCSLSMEECKALSDADCEGSKACEFLGKCRFNGDVCSF